MKEYSPFYCYTDQIYERRRERMEKNNEERREIKARNIKENTNEKISPLQILPEFFH
jgi:hypothetical protein